MADSRPSILAVDDTPENLQLLVALLQKDHKVRVATSGERALRLAEKAAPDLILLDVMMPEMDGFEVCRQLKLRPALVDVPVIFVSALESPQDRARALTNGGVDYISKPFLAEEVCARVATHLALRRMQLELRERDRAASQISEELRTGLRVLGESLERLRADLGERLSNEQSTQLDEIRQAARAIAERVSEYRNTENGEFHHRARAFTPPQRR